MYWIPSLELVFWKLNCLSFYLKECWCQFLPEFEFYFAAKVSGPKRQCSTMTGWLKWTISLKASQKHSFFHYTWNRISQDSLLIWPPFGWLTYFMFCAVNFLTINFSKLFQLQMSMQQCYIVYCWEQNTDVFENKLD